MSEKAPRKKGELVIKPEQLPAVLSDVPAQFEGEWQEFDDSTPAQEPAAQSKANKKSVTTARRRRGTGKKSVEDMSGEELAKEIESLGFPTTAPAEDRTPEPAPASPSPVPVVPDTGWTRREQVGALTERLSAFNNVEKPLVGTQLYEQRRASVADRLGLTEAYQAVNRAERDLFNAMKLATTRGYAQDDIGDLRQAYARAVYGWGVLLKERSAGADPRTRNEALVVRKRDSLLRMQQLEAEAKRTGMDAKAWYSLDKWINEETPARVAQATKVINKPTTWLADKMVRLMNPRLRGENIDARTMVVREDLVRKYVMGSRVVGGAAIATAVTVLATPVAAVSIPVVTVIALGRGVIGLGATLGLSHMGGAFYQKRRGDAFSAMALEARRAEMDTFEAYLESQEAFSRSNVHVRAREKATARLLAGVIGGGATGLLTSGAAHTALEHFSSLKGVQDSGDAISSSDVRLGVGQRVDSAAQPAVSAEAMKGVAEGTVTPVTPQEPLTAEGMRAYLSKPHPELIKPEYAAAQAAADAAPGFPASFRGIEPWSAVIDARGEGVSQLFVDMREHYGTLYPDPNQAPPAIQHILKAHSADALSREFGFIDATGKSLVVREGATLSIDDHGRLVFRGSATDMLSERTLINVMPDGTVKMSGMEGGVYRGGAAEAILSQEHPVSAQAPSSEGVVTVPVSEDVGVLPETPTMPPVSASDTPGPIESPATGGATYLSDLPDSDTLAQPSAQPVAPSSSGASEATAERPILTLADLPDSSEVLPEIIENSHGVRIDTAAPASYTWRAPESTAEYTAVFGGDAETVQTFARSQALANPGTRVLFNTRITDPLTGEITTRVDTMVADSRGNLERIEGTVDAAGKKLVPIEPEGLIRKRP